MITLPGDFRDFYSDEEKKHIISITHVYYILQCIDEKLWDACVKGLLNIGSKRKDEYDVSRME